MSKSDRDIMEILEAYDLTRCAHSAAQLCGVDEKTVARYVAIRDAGGDPFTRSRRVRSIDPFLPKVEQWVEASHGHIRADKVHERLIPMGYSGNERTTRRAVAERRRPNTWGRLLRVVDWLLSKHPLIKQIRAPDERRRRDQPSHTVTQREQDHHGWGYLMLVRVKTVVRDCHAPAPPRLCRINRSSP